MSPGISTSGENPDALQYGRHAPKVGQRASMYELSVSSLVLRLRDERGQAEKPHVLLKPRYPGRDHTDETVGILPVGADPLPGEPGYVYDVDSQPQYEFETTGARPLVPVEPPAQHWLRRAWNSTLAWMLG